MVAKSDATNMTVHRATTFLPNSQTTFGLTFLGSLKRFHHQPLNFG